MKRMTSIALFALVSSITIGMASAQERAVKADVPFDFTVANKLVPAGTYTIFPASYGVLKIQNSDSHVAILTTTTHDANESKTNKLVFNKIGNQYFLSEVLCSSADMNMSVPASKAEKRARVQVASLQNSSQVFIALK
jgi:hypothetical protein